MFLSACSDWMEGVYGRKMSGLRRQGCEWAVFPLRNAIQNDDVLYHLNEPREVHINMLLRSAGDDAWICTADRNAGHGSGTGTSGAECRNRDSSPQEKIRW